MSNFPIYKLRSIGLIVSSVIFCVWYSPNWIIGSTAIIVGFVIWIESAIAVYYNTTDSINLAINILNFALGVGITPFLLYAPVYM